MSAADDRAAIAALVYGYAERLDAGDLAGLGALFADATFRSDRGGHYRGAAEVRAVMERLVVLYDGVPRTKHVTTNLVIELAGDAASARAYFTVLQAAPGGPCRRSSPAATTTASRASTAPGGSRTAWSSWISSAT
ncbi:MAG: nuclear transport factor 2 family protein [Candidatus Binatia bacterium]